MGPGGILALDLSVNVGWAYGLPRQNAPPASGVWKLASGAGLGRILASFENELEDAIVLHAPRLIVTEAPLPPTARSNAVTWRQQLSLAGAAEASAWRHDILFREQACSTIRTELLGTCRFPSHDAKARVEAYCRAKGWPVYDHNAADACLVWEFTCRHLPSALLRAA